MMLIRKPRPGNQGAVVDVEFVLRLGEEDLADVVLGQLLTLDQHFTAVAFAEQDSRLVFALPAHQHGTAPVFEQQQRGQCNCRNLFELALQQPPLQPGTRGGARQQLGAQPLRRQRQAGGEHGCAGGFLMQGTKRQQPVQ